MPLEDFIITVFCWVDEHLKALLGDHRWRRRGFAPKLTDSEVITMEGVGEFLGLDTDVLSVDLRGFYPGAGGVRDAGRPAD